MKTRLALFLLVAAIFIGTKTFAEEQTRKVDSFTEISLRIGAEVHLEQGAKQILKLLPKRPLLSKSSPK